MVEFGDDSDNVERGARPRRSTFIPPSPRPRPRDSEAPAERFQGEDFLFHLYRGSELLQDNCISEAKEELERALRMQPQDVEGQGLLGVVYFRLGLYPRAIEIYSDVIRACPTEVSPKVNLGLCFLKTGQAAQARDILDEVIQHVPDHVRAWGYLGLALERLGDFERAANAFERAGQQHLARRMRRTLEERSSVEPSDAEPPERAEVRRAAADAVQELDGSESGFSRAHAELELTAPSRSGRWRAVEPGEEAVPRSPTRRPSLAGRFGPAVPAVPDPDELARPSRPPGSPSEAPPPPGSPEPTLAAPATESRTARLLRVKESAFVRGDAVRALLADGAPFTSSPVMRRMRGRDLAEPLGGPGAPWQLLEGEGSVLIGASHERELCYLELGDTFLYVRESALVAFLGGARHENGRLPTGGGEPIAMVQLSGRGAALLESRRALVSLEVNGDRKLMARADDVVGWTGRLLGSPVDPNASPLKAHGFVAFSGDGAVLLDLG